MTFSYAVSDGIAAPVATTASLDITPVNDAPVVANAIADQGATQGSPFTFPFAGNTFNDVDTGDTLNYAATLSNGSPLPSWLSFDAATRTFSGTPANGDVGSIAVKVTATDGGNASVSDIFNITVGNTNNAPVNTVPASALTVNEDVPLGFAGAISVHDVDGNLASTQLSVLSGALTVNLASGATISSGANGSGTLTLSGSETQINAALATLTYQGGPNFNGDDTLTVLSTDSGALTDSDTVQIHVTPVDDAPVASPVTLAAIAEDSGPRLITQAELLANASDVDGPFPLTAVNLAISSGSGTLTNNNDGTWTYHPALNDDTAVTFSYAVSDGIAAPVATTASLDITPVNDAPVAANTHGPYSATEQVALSLKNSGLLISDADAGGGPVTVTLSVGEGTLTVAAGGSGAVVSNSGTSSVTINGTVAQINALLNSDATSTVSYLDSNDAPGPSTTLSLSVNDNGNTGSGGALPSNIATATINIAAVNDAPVISGVPASASASENTPVTLVAPSGLVADVDAIASDILLATLKVSNGTLAPAGSVAGVTIVNGLDGSNGTLQFTGTQAAITQAIKTGVIYTPTANFVGLDPLKITVDDQGHSGTGGAQQATATIDITVANDQAPVVTAGNTIGYVEQAPAIAVDNALGVSDADTASLAGATVTISSGFQSGDTLTINGTTTGVIVNGANTINYSYDSGTHRMSLSGGDTVAHYQAALRLVAFSNTTNDDPTAGGTVNSRTLSWVANDGTLDSSIATTTINMAAVNDAPVAANTHGPYSATEQVALSLKNSGLLISDADAGGGPVTVTLSVGEGTLTVAAGGSGAVVSNSGTSSVTINGTVAQINALLNSDATSTVSYLDSSDAPGPSTTLSLSVNDNGNTGSGGALPSNIATATINIAAVNDAPVAANTHGPYSATEQVALSLKNSGLLISDADAGGGPVTVTLSVGEGTLTVAAGGSGAVVSNNGTSSVTINGTVAQINALLNSDATSTVSYLDSSDAPGPSTTLSLSVNDNGNTGSGGALPSNIATATINIAAVNDAPVLNSAATPVLAAENEGAGAPVGAVGTLVSSLVDLNPPVGGLNNVTDADSGAATGIALTATSTTNGSWWYSLDSGAHWTDVNAGSAVSNTNALLLAADAGTRIYFQPNANFSGPISAAITFRAWDQSSGAAGTKASTATNGGTTVFSSATDTADITINAVDHAPVIQAPDILTRVSVPGAVLAGTVPGTDSLATHAIAPDMNGEGRYVVFFSTENIPTQGDNNGLLAGDVFLYDRLSGATTTLTDAQHIPLGLRETGERFSGFAISGDGNFVVFSGTYTVNGQFGPQDVSKVYLYDRNADKVTLLTNSMTHATITAESNAQINGNGALIALVRNATDGQHVSVYKSDGTLIRDVTAANSVIPDTLDHFQQAAISNDGNYVSFWAYAQDANFNPTGLATLYVLDRQGNSITAVGQTTAAHDLWLGSLSRDGNRIVFQSDQNLEFKPE